MSALEQIPIEEGLFTWPAKQPQLIGSRCTSCGAHTFPRQEGCPRCSGTDTEDALLSSRGTLWTWTTQEFRPKTPPFTGPETEESFEPFLLGYVELPGQLKVETRLVDVEFEQLRLGLEMEIAIVPFRRDGDTEIMIFAFRPVA
jgi:uncharacterized OB-fold protein